MNTRKTRFEIQVSAAQNPDRWSTVDISDNATLALEYLNDITIDSSKKRIVKVRTTREEFVLDAKAIQTLIQMEGDPDFYPVED